MFEELGFSIFAILSPNPCLLDKLSTIPNRNQLVNIFENQKPSPANWTASSSSRGALGILQENSYRQTPGKVPCVLVKFTHSELCVFRNPFCESSRWYLKTFENKNNCFSKFTQIICGGWRAGWKCMWIAENCNIWTGSLSNPGI